MSYVVDITLEDKMIDAPRRTVRTTQSFRYESEAESFAEMFKSWLPVQNVEVVEIDEGEL